MLKRIFLYFLLIMPSCVCQAENYHELFLKANELYKQQQYADAQHLYKQIPNKSPKVHYNLGNCLYKQGKLGHALLYWRRAENNWGIFNKEELLGNIALAHKELRDRFENKNDKKGPLVELIKFIQQFRQWFRSFVRSASLLVLQLLFLFFWICSFLYFKYVHQRRYQFILIVLFLITALFGGLLVMKYNMNMRKFGIVIRDKAQLLSGPDEHYQTLSFLPEGSEGVIKKTSGAYYKVKIARQIGWVHRDSFEKI